MSKNDLPPDFPTDPEKQNDFAVAAIGIFGSILLAVALIASVWP
jgi:hypothetical protein